MGSVRPNLSKRTGEEAQLRERQDLSPPASEVLATQVRKALPSPPPPRHELLRTDPAFHTAATGEDADALRARVDTKRLVDTSAPTRS